MLKRFSFRFEERGPTEMGKRSTPEGAGMDQSIPFMSTGKSYNETSFLSQKRQPHVLNMKHEGPSES